MFYLLYKINVMRFKTLIILSLLVINQATSQDLTSFFNKTDTFLNTYVSEGNVAYSNIKANPKQLNDLLVLANNISVSKDDAKNYQAFWINAYNLTVIKSIIDYYPIKSPLDKSGFFDSIKHTIGGKKVTLNDIENNLLRAQFKDARFHFVLVCGAIGCPPLINKAYLPNTLEAQLEKQTRVALNGSFLKINTKKKKVEGSEILKWYKEDFTRNGETEIDFINKYRIEKIPSNFKLSYFTYNWNLNKQ